MDIVTFLMILSLVLIFYLIGILKNNHIKQKKGKEGERTVANSLNFWVKRKNKNYVYHDITLPTSKGHTTQIDHLVLSRKGIFVIETKNLNGILIGDVDQTHWKHINHLKKENQIYNPIFQNNGHLKHISALLNIPKHDLVGVVTNVGDAKLKGSINPLLSKPVIRRGTGFAFSIWWSSKKVFSQEQIDAFKSIIDKVMLEQSALTNEKHIDYVKRFKKKDQNPNWAIWVVLGVTVVICFMLMSN